MLVCHGVLLGIVSTRMRRSRSPSHWVFAWIASYLVADCGLSLIWLDKAKFFSRVGSFICLITVAFWHVDVCDAYASRAKQDVVLAQARRGHLVRLREHGQEKELVEVKARRQMGREEQAVARRLSLIHI